MRIGNAKATGHVGIANANFAIGKMIGNGKATGQVVIANVKVTANVAKRIGSENAMVIENVVNAKATDHGLIWNETENGVTENEEIANGIGNGKAIGNFVIANGVIEKAIENEETETARDLVSTHSEGVLAVLVDFGVTKIGPIRKSRCWKRFGN